MVETLKKLWLLWLLIWPTLLILGGWAVVLIALWLMLPIDMALLFTGASMLLIGVWRRVT